MNLVLGIDAWLNEMKLIMNYGIEMQKCSHCFEVLKTRFEQDCLVPLRSKKWKQIYLDGHECHTYLWFIEAGPEAEKRYPKMDWKNLYLFLKHYSADPRASCRTFQYLDHSNLHRLQTAMVPTLNYIFLSHYATFLSTFINPPFFSPLGRQV